MKILWLSNSDEVQEDVPPESRASHLAATLVEAGIGEPVEVIPRVIWPSPQLPGIIDGWMDRYSPDMVVFHVNGFWYLYSSVPLMFQRKFGRLGPYLTKAGLKAGSTSWIVKTRAYHLARGLALKTVGGATYFTPQEVCDTVEACVRRIIRREGVGLVVRAPVAPSSWNSAPAGAFRFVHRSLSALCESLHVTYLGQDPDLPDATDQSFWTGGDRLHTNAEGHAWYAQLDAGAIIAEWGRLHPSGAQPAAPAG